MTENKEGKGWWRRNRWSIAAWSAAMLMLLLPLMAMQFSDEVDWSVTDFIIFGALLFGVGVAFELVVRRTGKTAYRAAAAVALAAALILVWANGAVGFIGNESNDANVMFSGVLAVGIIGAIIARFQARGMARSLLATAFAQVLVAVIALIAGFGSEGQTWPREILILTGFFTAVWLLSAWLFRCAARQ